MGLLSDNLFGVASAGNANHTENIKLDNAITENNPQSKWHCFHCSEIIEYITGKVTLMVIDFNYHESALFIGIGPVFLSPVLM